jgi:hypothetical protein
VPATDAVAAILALARAGASSRAWTAFVDAGLGNVAGDPKILTLKGRLLKDQARRATGHSRAGFYLAAADAYADAAKIQPDSYPLINAAAMSLFAGRPEHMRLLAQQVLDLMRSGAGAGETPYWHEATRAEALLLLGEVEAAKATLADAVAHAPAAWEDRATTIRQFREIAAALDLPGDWLADFAPPPSLVFSGIMGIDSNDIAARRDIEIAVKTSGAGFAYGALAAGADIMIAEALVAVGAELHVVLPAMTTVFRSKSVEPFGADWGGRFDRLLDRAESVTIVNGCTAVSDGSIKLAALVARGMAVDHAHRMESLCRSMGVIDNSDKDAPAYDINVKAVRTVQSSALVAIEPANMVLLIAGAAKETFIRHDLAEISTLHGMRVAASDDVKHAARALARLAGSRTARPVAATLVVTDNGQTISDSDIAQVVRLAQSTPEGSVGASMEAAMATKALHPDIRIEPIGELPDQGRALAMYALTRILYSPGAIAGGGRLV